MAAGLLLHLGEGVDVVLQVERGHHERTVCTSPFGPNSRKAPSLSSQPSGVQWRVARRAGSSGRKVFWSHLEHGHAVHVAGGRVQQLHAVEAAVRPCAATTARGLQMARRLPRIFTLSTSSPSSFSAAAAAPGKPPEPAGRARTAAGRARHAVQAHAGRPSSRSARGAREARNRKMVATSHHHRPAPAAGGGQP